MKATQCGVARMRLAAISSMVLMAAWLGVALTAPAQQYEYEPDEGLHQEEWYDPSDWFNNDNVTDYENDWWDAPYGYETGWYAGDDWYTDDYWETGAYDTDWDDDEWGYDDSAWGYDDDYWDDTWD